MARILCVALALVLVAATASAQELNFPEIRPMKGEKLSLAESLKREYIRVVMNITDEAERMPEEHYNFRPTPDIRSYGELMGHVANSQFSICSVLRKIPNPNRGNNLEKTVTTKAGWVKAVKDSFAHCDPFFMNITHEQVLEYVTEGEGELTRGGSIAHFLAHGNDVYGYAAVYMRLKGLVPPTTERGMGQPQPQPPATPATPARPSSNE